MKFFEKLKNDMLQNISFLTSGTTVSCLPSEEIQTFIAQILSPNVKKIQNVGHGYCFSVYVFYYHVW